MWDYSRKLDPKEIESVMGLFSGSQERDDGRSTSRSADYLYYGKCYTLTLFAFK
jgi:cobyrinic acid a,c-diamide synthase